MPTIDETKGLFMDLNVRQWEKVAAAPVIVFVLIAYADRKLTPKEEKTFTRKWLPRLLELNIAPDEPSKDIYRWHLGEEAFNTKKWTKKTVGTLLDELESTFTLWNRKAEEPARSEFPKLLEQLAEDIAKASGGFPLLVSAINEDEWDMLTKVKHALRGRPML